MVLKIVYYLINLGYNKIICVMHYNIRKYILIETFAKLITSILDFYFRCRLKNDKILEFSFSSLTSTVYISPTLFTLIIIYKQQET